MVLTFFTFMNFKQNVQQISNIDATIRYIQDMTAYFGF